jgi:molecular chaperone GrpE
VSETDDKGNGPTAAADPLPDEEKGVAAVPQSEQQQLEAVQRERDELKDQLLRRRAEFDNYKKRVERDRAVAGVEAAVALLKSLVPTLDNLDRALEVGGSETSIREGVELIRRDLHAILESQGVGTEDPRGQPFDPERHQALSHEAVPGVPDGTVAETFRKGYTYKDRLLRPALVKVAKAADPSRNGPDAVH